MCTCVSVCVRAGGAAQRDRLVFSGCGLSVQVGLWGGPSPGYAGPPASAPLGFEEECPHEWTGLAPGRMKPGRTPALEGGWGPVRGVLRAKEGLSPHTGQARLLHWHRAATQRLRRPRGQGAQGRRTGQHPTAWAGTEVGKSVRSFPWGLWRGFCNPCPHPPALGSPWPEGRPGAPATSEKVPSPASGNPGHTLWQPVQTCPLGVQAPVSPALCHQW